MVIDGPGSWRTRAARWRRRWAPGALVLLYHRVHDADSDPWSLAVSPSNFSDHLRVLRRLARPVPLQTLARAAAQGRRLPRHVAVTFDDGYVDNHTQALPLLVRHEVPATVFVVSACVGQAREFWWDELERLLLRPGRLPCRLQLSVGGQRHAWDLGAHAGYSEGDFARHRAWRAGGDDAPTPRHRAYTGLHRLLGALGEAARRAALDQLAGLAGLRPPAARADRRPLTRDELVAMDRSGWIEVGVHTRTHPMLDQLAPEQQRDEIHGARDDLEALLQRPMCSFAYPYGRLSAETPRLVQEAGLACACTVNPGDVRADSDPFRLNRVIVGNWSGEVFAHRLGQWLAGG